jgi:hypothetical protein
VENLFIIIVVTREAIKLDKEVRKQQYRDYYYRHRKKRINSVKEYRKTHPEVSKKSNKKYIQKLRLEVLIHYGGNPPKCACCGERENRFLTLDHINNNGAEERRKISRVSAIFYLYLIRNNYPEGYRILCYNCNLGRAKNNGICPHAQKETNK